MTFKAIRRWATLFPRHAKRRRSSRPRDHRKGLRGGLETLEQRTMLSVSGLPGFDNLAVDPQSYDSTGFLVRFQSEGANPAALEVVAGTAVGNAMPLVSGLRKVRLVDPCLSVAQALAAYRANPNVLYAEPDYRIHLEGIPNDPDFSSLWGLNNTGQAGGTPDADIDAPEAWDITTGNRSTIVAVIDTGVDYNHPDLAANIWTNPDEIPGDGIDNDGNGYVDDVHGYDFVNHDADPMDDQGHGTHVAGTIGAVGNNGVGVAGINWQVQIMALKFLDATGSGSTSDAIDALNYAVANGATIVNASWGGDPYSQALYDAIRNARDAGVIFVAAAGNNGANNDQAPFYPAGYDLANIIAVAATDRNDRLASFSNYGATTVDLAAPGVDILSTKPNNTYQTASGTSMAAPHVAGVAALVRGLHPDWTYQQVIDQVLNSVDSVPGLAGRTATGGRLNAARAVGARDSQGPYVLQSDPSGGVGGVVSSIRLTFQESIDPTSFDAGDIASFVGPQGAIPVAGVAEVPNSLNRQFDVTFAPQAAFGTYTMVIGPSICDLAGNWMDQNQNGVGGEVPGDRYTASFTIGDRRVFSAGDLPKTLSPFSLTTSTVTVDQDLSIADVDVRIDVAYPDVGLLDVSLVSPWGTTISLAPTTTFLGADYQNTLFDDEAALPTSGGTPPFAGDYRPASPLSALDGRSARGTWQLNVNDLWFSSGSVNSWSLSILPNPPRLNISDETVVEGNSGITWAIFDVSLSNAVGEPVTVDYATADGTATSGSDYQAASGTLTFPPGELTKTISVAVYGDVLPEPAKSFFVNLSNPSRATIADGQGLGVILSDEAVLSVDDVSLLEGNSGIQNAVFTVSLAAPSLDPVSVSYATADGTALAGSDYIAAGGVLTFAPGEVSKTVPVGVKGDTANELDETFFLNLANPVNALIGDGQGQATIVNDDPLPSLSVNSVTLAEGNVGTKTFTFTISLSAASGRTVTVPYATVDGTATAGVDYVAASGVLTFLPGQTWRAVNVVVNGDSLPEADETFFLNLGAPSAAILLVPQGVGTILNDDTSISIADVQVQEGDSGTTTAGVTVSLSGAVGFPVSVNYATANGTATAGSDYAGTKGTLTFAPGETSKTIAIDVIGDRRNEGDETFCVNLSQPRNALLADSQAVVTILDDDPLPTISVADVALAEGQSGAKSFTFTLALSAASGRTVTVNYATADGTATAGSDYVAKSGVVTLYAGATSQTVSITVNGDTECEGDESFFLNLSGAVNAALATDRATGTILDDDNLRIGDVSIIEGADGVQAANFAVTLAAPLPNDVTFDYATANGTASAGSDYVATSGRATIPSGSTSIVIPVLVIGDTRNEGDETFYLNLTNVAGLIPADTQGMATIVDDDPLPGLSVGDVVITEGNSGTKNATFTLTLSSVCGRTLWVSYATADGTATAGSDYLAKSGTLIWYAGSQTQTVSVVVNGDTTVEPDKTFFLNVSNPVNVEILKSQGVATIVNDDPNPALAITDVKATEGNSGTKSFYFTVSLSAASTQTVAVQYSTADGTATAGSDYIAQGGTLTFLPGQTSKLVGVAVIGDTASEPDETFFLNLSNPINAVFLDAQGMATILNDDNSITIGDAAVIEGDSGTVAATFLVSLSAPAAHEIRVDYATAAGTATAGSDFVPVGGTLTFAPGETSKTISVPVVGDRINEADETLLVNLANPVGAQIAHSQGLGTIRDDDPLPAISVADASIVEGNSGTKTLNFVVKLSAPSGRTVTVNYATANGTATAGSDYVAKSGVLGFYPGSTSQTISITINADTLPEYNETLLLNLSGATYATLANSQAVGTILDDDCLSISDATVTEGNSGTARAVFAVNLALPLPYEVRVDYATVNGTAYAGTDYVAAGGTVVFAPYETSRTITVLTLGDQVDEPDKTFYLDLSNPVNIALSGTRAKGTILDDDPPPSLSINDVTLTDGNAGTKNATFTISLSSASGQTVTVNFATSDGTATAGTDYIGKTGTLTFYAGTVTQTISVVVNGDMEVEPDETFLVTLSSPTNAVLARSRGWGTILNDDGDSSSSSTAASAAFWAAFAGPAPILLGSPGDREPKSPGPPIDICIPMGQPTPAQPIAAADRFWAALGAGDVDLWGLDGIAACR